MNTNDRFEASNTPIDLSKYQQEFEVDRLDLIKTILSACKGQSALDIGCGPGAILQILAKQGWQVTGIDTDPENLDKASKHASEVIQGNVIDVLPELPDEQYDLVMALELIEHMPKPLGISFIEQVSRILKPGGELLISTPNTLSPEGLGGYYWGEKIRGIKWDAWDTTHIHIYNSFEIIHLLKNAGFNIDKVVGFWYGGWLPMIGKWSPSLKQSQSFPLNRLGFITMIKCTKV